MRLLLDAYYELPGDTTSELYVLSCELKTKLFCSLVDCNTHKELCKLQITAAQILHIP